MVIGAGQAGLAASYYLTKAGKNHVVLEHGSVGERWRSGVWDSFTLVLPNWTVQLPGFPYNGSDPDGFMTKAEIVNHLEAYADSFHPPLRLGTKVESLKLNQAGRGYVVDAGDVVFETPAVVVATGPFQQPRIPSFAAKLQPGILQIHSSEYRNPDALPQGNVLVVGTAQSGAQIAEELIESGRKVHLSVSSSGRFPRRYRGKAFDRFLAFLLETTVDKLPPALKSGVSHHVSGKNGGHEINLRQLAKDGAVLLGHVRDISGRRISFAPDLMEDLAKADAFAIQMKKNVDDFILKSGIEAPMEDSVENVELLAWPKGDPITFLDTAAEGITCVVWATGYKTDFSWIRAPVFDETGYPIHQRGVTKSVGLYFVGLRDQYKLKSPLLYGVGEDTAFVISHISTS